MSFGDEMLHPRRLLFDLDAEMIEDETLSETVCVPKVIHIGPQDEELSLVTTVPALTPLTLEPSFTLDPEELEAATRSLCLSLPNKESPNSLSPCTLMVLDLQHLPLCSQEYKTISCPCMQMSHLASPDFQNDIRKLYCMICVEGNECMGDEFLMSMMTSRHTGSINKECASFLIPGFIEGGECRKFWLCRAQFMNLFGLDNKSLCNIEMRWRQRRPTGWSHMTPFGWSENLTSYHVGNKVYVARLEW